MNKMKNLWKFYFINISTSSKREEPHLKQKYQDTSRKLVIFADFLTTEVDETHTDGKRTKRTTIFTGSGLKNEFYMDILPDTFTDPSPEPSPDPTNGTQNLQTLVG